MATSNVASLKGRRSTLPRARSAQTASSRGQQRLPGQVDAGHIAKAPQLDGGAAGAAARVEDAQVGPAVERVVEDGEGDAAHAGIPPVARLAARHDRVLFSFHTNARTCSAT